MRHLYLCVILKLFLNDAWGRVKFTRINLTRELGHYDSDLLLNINTVRIPYKATLKSLPHRTRIVGGQPIHIKEQPSVAFLAIILPWSTNFKGGAVIIGRHWAVTAAHCFKYISDLDIKDKQAFVCGNTSSWIKGCKKHLIIKKYVHEKYNEKEVDFDIALIKVKDPFNGKFEKPIKWANSNYKYPDNGQALVFGWGTTNSIGEDSTDNLRFTTIRLINHNICKSRYKQNGNLVTDRMLCAGDKGKDACINDSGGPLIQNKVLIGIISWGTDLGCAHEYLPGVYTKVSLFDSWIRKKMGLKARSMRRTKCDDLPSNVTNKQKRCDH